jgi:outer membrane protein TolC
MKYSSISKLTTGIILIFLIIAWHNGTSQQTLTIEQCFEDARTNHPLRSKLDLTNQIATFNVENAKKQYLPKIDLTGQATYQSEVTLIPIEVPGFEVESLTRDQYKLSADIYQSIIDGGRVKSMVRIQEASAQLENAQVEADIYQVRQSVINTYFGILKVEAQQQQLQKTIETLEAQFKKVSAAVENGISLPGNKDALEAEILNVQQSQIALDHQKKMLVKNISTLTNKTIDASSTFNVPDFKNMQPGLNSINRPELRVLQSGRQALQAKQAMVDANVKPTLGAFVSAGYGKPGLNFLENAFSPYYVAGIRLKWNISQLYTKRNETEVNTLEAAKIQADENQFLRNIQFVEDQFLTEIERLETSNVQEEQILVLRTKMRQRAEKQLENGVITSADYITEVNHEQQVRISLELRQLEINQLNYQLIHLYGFDSSKQN